MNHPTKPTFSDTSKLLRDAVALIESVSKRTGSDLFYKSRMSEVQMKLSAIMDIWLEAIIENDMDLYCELLWANSLVNCPEEVPGESIEASAKFMSMRGLRVRDAWKRS